ncbi:MAG: hypothetical protein KBE31_06575, partial [Tidjanibacter sp.]|nr:hypothetical protein [Tidjanibacter sp.]
MIVRLLYKLNKSFLRTFGRAFRNVPAAGRNVNGKAAVIVWGAAGAGHTVPLRDCGFRTKRLPLWETPWNDEDNIGRFRVQQRQDFADT